MRALLFVVALAGIAAAQPGATQSYRVKPKDTLEIIAAEFYGSRDNDVLIAAENKLKTARVVPFTRLKLPVTRELTAHQVETGAHVRVNTVRALPLAAAP